VEAAGLTGRGGAGFPTHRKLRAVAAGRSPVVVANGSEGEPASGKDATLLSLSPHLVLDGLQLAAHAVGARRVHLILEQDSPALDAVRAAVGERGRRRSAFGPEVKVVETAARFLSGEESAVASRVSGGPPIPRATPPRVFEKGVDGRPTLVQNVETLAHLALIARFGAPWFRGLGTAAEPGSALLTVGGAVRWPGVTEAGLGTAVTELIAAAGGPSEPLQAILLGGYHGAWLTAAEADTALLSNEDLRPWGATVGAGVLFAFPTSACGVVETARVLSYLAAESAGQCGPCRLGLPAIAQALRELAGAGQATGHRAQIERWANMVDGRGSCHHPDGTVRFLRGALRVFDSEFELHARGGCTALGSAAGPPLMPVPERLGTVPGLGGW
jgi:NADH:ubiquinone oxidoreductase subunit F (NADH-binding)